MFLSDLAIKRPVFITMIMSALAFFGILTFSRIGIDLYPQVDFPVISVCTSLPGADPQTIETTVSKPIEDALSSISSIKHLYSTSAENLSQVVIEFDLEKNIDIAYQEVLAKIGTIRDKLPDDIEEPIIEKEDLNAAPILALLVSGKLSTGDLSYLADKIIKERLQSIDGVGRITVVGKRERTIWIDLDPKKLEGFHLSIDEVIRALQAQHIDLPGGPLKKGPITFSLKTKAEYTNVQDFEQVVIAYVHNAPIHLSDISTVIDGFEDPYSLARFQDQQALTLLIRKQSGKNTVSVVKALKQNIELLKQELASRHVSLEIAQDFSLFIEQSVTSLQEHLFFGGFLAVAIVFIFLRNAQMTIISALTLPLSVLATFILMYALNFTMNTMTMLALSLAIGILIDDAIVVIENIYRHFKKINQASKAAAEGTQEIGLAAFAITMSIVAVFLPVAFMKGIVGRFFYQFGMTVAFSVLMSLFIAFTLTPMLASKYVKQPKEPSKLSKKIDLWLLFLQNIYTTILQKALKHKKQTLSLAFGCLIISFLAFCFVKSEFAPMEDQNEFYVRAKAPLGYSLEATDALIIPLRQKLQERPWLRYCLTTLGTGSLEQTNEGLLYVKMVSKKNRTISQMDAMQEVRTLATQFPILKLSVEPVQDVSGGSKRTAALQIDFKGPSLITLEQIANTLLAHLKGLPGYVDQDSSFDNNKPELILSIKRDYAAAVGVTPEHIARTIKTCIGGYEASTFTADGERYTITVRLQEPFRSQEDLLMLTVANDKGELISLANLITLKETKGPVTIERSNRQRTITIYANLDDAKKTLGEAVSEINSFISTMDLPAGYSYRFSGNAEMMSDSFGYMLLALGLSIILIYMILASQFESFLHPLTIMLSLPFAFIGAFLGLLITNSTLNIFTCIGLIMLLGLVTKNGILLVDYTNTLRKQENLPVEEALQKASSTRLIPILMTTLSMIFGMLPSALSRSEGSESSAPMAIAVIGGLISSMFLTLLVLPVVYTSLESWRQKIFKNRAIPCIKINIHADKQ